ncbi:pentapeptide repeat-containing protein [Campylobacter coli]
MKELTKEQRQIIENKIKQEVENFNTFLDRQYCIDKIYKTIINRIKSHYDIGFDFLTIIEKNITEIDKISYEVIAIEEIKQILNIEDNIRYISGVFYIFGLSRTNLKTQVHGVVDILSLFETYPLVFDHCIFTQRIGYFNQITNIKKISFLNCEFEEQIYLNFQECLDIFQMDNCVFEDRVTIKGKFNDNVYFNNSIFKDYANFHTCEFEKTANFYGVRFEKTPNFSQAIFKGNLNVVNTNLNFTFDDLQERIKQEYASYETQRTAKEAGVIPNLYQKKSLDKFANDFRDSFRTFKNALIKDNNLLDASNFHKYELYCKEIELKQNWGKKGENVKNTTDLEKNVSRIRDFVDFLLLGFYRKLCDHHTDFLKVFNNLILLIALYALFVFGFTWLHDDKLEDTRAILTLFGFFDKFRLYFDIISAIFVVFGCGFFVWKLNSYEKKNNVSKKQNINFIYIIGDFWNLTKSLFFASFIPCVFYVLFSLFGFFLNLGKDFGYSLLINTLFVSLYICLVYTKSLFFGRYVVLIFSYIVFIIMLIKQPNVIHPLIGKIANESDKFFNYPSLIVLNILYTILLALVLFSLQKTARKNSIVPS